MTGPEHYLESERLLRVAGSGFDEQDQAIRAEAQVHATLSLAAATIDAQRGGMDVWQQWPAASGAFRS